jgi:hypothetical protein
MANLKLKIDKKIEVDSDIFKEFFLNNSIVINCKKSDIYLLLSNLILLLDTHSKEKRMTFNLYFEYKNVFCLINFSNGYSKNNDISMLKNISLRFLDLEYSLKSKKEIKINEVFYSVNYPEEREGCYILEVAEDTYKYMKNKPLEKNIKLNIGKHRTHYLKWNLNEDISIRYFFLFEDSKERENCFFIKSHSEKMYIKITKEQAEIMIKKFGVDYHEEIVGKLVNNKYYKSVISFNKE